MKRFLAIALLLTIPASGATSYTYRSTTQAAPCNAWFVLDAGGGSSTTHFLSAAPFGNDSKTYITGSGHPNATTWNGSYTVKVNITTPAVNASTLDVTVSRYNSSCVFQEAYTLGSLNIDTTGVKQITATAPFATASCSDFFAVNFSE